MMSSETAYCTHCAHESDARSRFCLYCGARREMAPGERAGHLAFMLNELRDHPMLDVVTEDQRGRLERYYESRLGEIVAPRAARAPAAAVAPAPAAVQPVAPARPAGPRPPPPPPVREPFDWSWLTEQQANLFLFAGAFLTVVAALIYVGYSGETLSGPFKMALLIGYTLAFLAGGAFCLRIPRVEMAGRVFFAVGALLVPMNFAAARTILSDENLSNETMWLAGSVVTAAFYTAVAWTGLGRMYAFGAGVAVLSGALAGIAVTETPLEWAPLVVIAVAFAMLLTDVAGNAQVRERIGVIWGLQAQTAAPVAMAFAVMLAPFVASDYEEWEWTTRWYLPVTFAAFAAAAGVPTLITRRAHYGVAAAAGVAGAWFSAVYAFELPAEAYAVASGGLALLFGAALVVLREDAVSSRLPAGAGTFVFGAGVAATAAAAVVAGALLIASTDELNPYVIHSRWFVPSSFALSLAFYALAGVVRRDEAVSVGGTLAMAATWFAAVYALDLPAEAYAIAAGALAPVIGVGLVLADDERVTPHLPAMLRETLFAAALATTALAAIIVLAVAQAAYEDAYTLSTRWFALSTSALATIFYAIDASLRRGRTGVVGTVLGVTAVCASVVYGLDASAEYYAFALITPAVTFAAALRWAPERLTASVLDPRWRDDALIIARCIAAAAIAVAAGAVLAAADEASTYAPDSRWFLPALFGAAAAFSAIDASRGRRAETTAALVLMLIATAVAVPYALEAQAAWYGVALIASGVALVAARRTWSPSWVDGRVVDAIGAMAAGAATLPFEGAYRDMPRIGAAVHLAAAAFFAIAAITDRSEATLQRLLDLPQAARVRLATGWLYAAGFAAVIGYVYVLRSLPAAEEAEAGTLAVPMALAAGGFLLIGAGCKVLRPEFRLHLYLMSLLGALVSISMAPDALTLAALLSGFAAAYAVIAVYEDAPVFAAPAAVFAFAAVPAWRQHADAPLYVIPLAYSAIAIAAYAAAFALRATRRWSLALRAAGAAYALMSPAVGFGMLAVQEGDDLHRSALYQWSTLAVAVAGVAALVESSLSRRRWIIVPASAVLTVALLLQVGRFDPQNVQPYTAIIGGYLVLLAVVGLSRLRLIPALTPSATYIEALGAATVMLPTFVQSFDSWGYQLVLVIEASAFLTAGITLRRRGILAAAITALVLAASHALFDAVNALPNWIVVALAGIALLGIGMAILVGRERWDRWQRALVSWWEEADHGAPV